MFAASKSGSAADPTDAQFNYVTMLLHGDGTNGAQNNTFLDSSTNNFTITRNGNTTQGTFTPYGSNWSNYFDGTGDYLTVPDNAVLDMGSSDFTIEGWVFLSSTGSSQTFVAKGTGAGNQASYHIVFNGTNWLYYLSGNGSTWSIASGVTMGAGTANTWQHLALVRSGSTFTPYVNGTAGTTTSSATALFDSTNVFSIGADDATNQRITGYISNCRVVKGTAVYTSAFTPSTTPLTAITNTQLLTCQSNRFIDNSSNAFTVTKAGDTSVQRFSPFAPLIVYNPTTYGGSAYFDGSGDYLSLTPTSALNLSTNNWTIEMWVNVNTVSSLQVFINFGYEGSTQRSFILYLTSSNVLQFAYSTNGSNNTDTSLGASGITTGTWNHLAVVRNSTTITVYRNGVAYGTTITIGASAINYTPGAFRIGVDATNYTNGYITDCRLVNGTAVYTSAFTPPTAPLTAITNTSLLLSYTNAGILDNAMMNDLETVGNAQISTSVKKYGTGSLAFDGTGDYLQAPNTVNANFNNGDFTVEFWIYASSQILAPIVHQTSYASNQGWIVWNYDGVTPSASTRKLTFMANGATFVLTTSSDAYVDNTWTHIAVVKNGTGSNNIKIYSNGTSIATGTYATALANPSTPLMVGGVINGQSWNGTYYLNGYIDDLRITKGVARYTANFSVPTAAFADKG